MLDCEQSLFFSKIREEKRNKERNIPVCVPVSQAKPRAASSAGIGRQAFVYQRPRYWRLAASPVTLARTLVCCVLRCVFPMDFRAKERLLAVYYHAYLEVLSLPF